MGKGWLRVESKLEGTGFVRYFVIVIIVLHARQWLWWWSRQQWHTGEDTEYPELPPSRKRFIQIMMMPMIQLLFHLCPLPFPSLHLPLIPHPPFPIIHFKSQHSFLFSFLFLIIIYELSLMHPIFLFNSCTFILNN